MILPKYKIEIVFQNKSQLLYKIFFDKVVVSLYGDAKYSRLEIRLTIKDGCRRRNVCLLEYLNAINDFLESNNYVGKYGDKCIDLLDSNIVKFLAIQKMKITSGEMEYIKYRFPNLFSFRTEYCTIYDKANMGVLNCMYIDYKSNIISLDSFNGFSGRNLTFQKSHIINNNKRVLHLDNVVLKFDEVDINYETFILTLDAPNLRKLDIIRARNKRLSNNDLLFISGLYNLESIEIDAIINSTEQIKKLERLREVRGVLLNNPSEMRKTKQYRKKYYNIMKEKGAAEEDLNHYLMYQSMIQYNKYLDLLNELYVKRLDRIKWENKIYTNDIEKIKKELIELSKMFYKERRKIAREIKELTLKDQLDGLWFDGIPENEEEEYMTNSKPFSNDGIDYYVKSKKIMLDK